MVRRKQLKNMLPVKGNKEFYMNFVKSILDKTNGKKTLFGIFAAVIYTGLVSQGIITRDPVVEAAIFTITGVGVGHKLFKS